MLSVDNKKGVAQVVLVNVAALEKYMEQQNLNMPQLAEKLNIEYSYLYRIMKGEKIGGGKVISGLISLCAHEGLDIADYIFLPTSLSVDIDKRDETSATKETA